MTMELRLVDERDLLATHLVVEVEVDPGEPVGSRGLEQCGRVEHVPGNRVVRAGVPAEHPPLPGNGGPDLIGVDQLLGTARRSFTERAGGNEPRDGLLRSVHRPAHGDGGQAAVPLPFLDPYCGCIARWWRHGGH
jgi:hypothetical protein